MEQEENSGSNTYCLCDLDIFRICLYISQQRFSMHLAHSKWLLFKHDDSGTSLLISTWWCRLPVTGFELIKAQVNTSCCSSILIPVPASYWLSAPLTVFLFSRNLASLGASRSFSSHLGAYILPSSTQHLFWAHSVLWHFWVAFDHSLKQNERV